MNYPLPIGFACCILFLTGLCSCKSQNLFQQNRKQAKASDSIFLSENTTWTYHLRKDDKVNIGIWNNDDISVGSVYGIYNSGEGYGKYLMVDAKGEIPVPQLGNVKVEGLSITELKDTLTKEFSRTLRSPVIDVKILNKDITVLGEVKSPGKIHLEKEKNTLVEVLGQAGDFELYGNKKKIQVIREVNNRIRTITLDLTSATALQNNNILIRPGDIVYVPSRKRKEWDKMASSSIVPAASAITAILLIFKTFF